MPASSSRRCSPTAPRPRRSASPTKLPVPVTVRLELARIAAVDDLDSALEHYRLLVDGRARDLRARELRQRHPAPARDAQGRGGPRARRRGHRVRPRRARGAHAPAHARHDARQARLVVVRRAARLNRSGQRDDVELPAHGQRALGEGAARRPAGASRRRPGTSRASRHWRDEPASGGRCTYCSPSHSSSGRSPCAAARRCAGGAAAYG